MATVGRLRSAAKALALVLVVLLMASLAPGRGTVAADGTSVFFLATDPASSGEDDGGIGNPTPGDGATTRTTVGDKPALRVSAPSAVTPGNLAYFDVDDNFMRRGNYPFAAVTIEYYDQGYGNFRLQYDATGNNAFKSTSGVFYLANSNTWKTRTFYLSDAWFDDRTNGGDFRVLWAADAGAAGAPLLAIHKVTVTRYASLVGVAGYDYSGATTVSLTVPDSDGNQAGLYLVSQGDGKVSYGTQGTTSIIKPSSDGGFAYFDVADTYVLNGMGGNGTAYSYAKVDVELYDDGSGKAFNVQYNAIGGAAANSSEVYLNGPVGWRTASFYLSDVTFNNALGGSTDFRLKDAFGGAAYAPGWLQVRKVMVTRGTTDFTPSFAGAGSVSFQAPGSATSTGLNLVNIPGTDGVISAVTAGDRAAIQVSSAGYAYFDVDNTFLFQGSSAGTAYGDVTVEVSYFDQGYGFFYLDYDSAGPRGAAAETARAWRSFGPGPGLEPQLHNLVYLSDSKTWKTYTFYLANVYFGNRLFGTAALNYADGKADFRVSYLTTDATAANMGYLLALDKVAVTRFTSPPDLTGTLEGNHGGHTELVGVWTRLGGPNEAGHGLRQYEGADGTTTVETQAKEQSRRSTSQYMYFNVNDKYVYQGNAYHVYVAVEYFDSPGDTFRLEYDAGPSAAYRKTESVARTGTNLWKTYTFMLLDAYFGNGQANGNADFRITAASSDLNVKGVFVLRAPGNNIAPRGTVNLNAISSYAAGQRLVATHYFPVFDGHYPTMWPPSSMGPVGAAATNHVQQDYSWRSVATLKQDLTDMSTAGVDIASVWYHAGTAEASLGGVETMKNLVQAHRTLASEGKSAPRFALLLDPEFVYQESYAKAKQEKVDLTSAVGKALYFKMAEDFYSLVPSDLWAAINGRPIIYVYFQGTSEVTNYDRTTFEYFLQRFERSFGVRPYLILDSGWDPMVRDSAGVWTRQRSLPADEWFSWGAAAAQESGMMRQGSAVGEVGPGYNKPAHGARDRENGAFYARSWQRLSAKGPHMVAVETWNYWAEGSAVAPSAEYASTYFDATKQYISSYKTTGYGTRTTVKATLGATNVASGLYQDEITDGATQVATDVGGGRRATGTNMYFSVHDSFLFDVPSGRSIKVRVTYWGVGPEAFYLKYDGANSPYEWDGDQAGGVFLGKIGEQTPGWKTREFVLSNARFTNQQAEANDFRLESSGGLVVSEVVVEKPAALVAGVQSSPQSLVYRVGTTSDLTTPRTIMVGNADYSYGGSWTASASVPWISLSATSGTSLPALITVSTNPAAATGGINVGYVYVNTTGAAGLSMAGTPIESAATQLQVPIVILVGPIPNQGYLPLVVKNYRGGW